MRQRLCTHDGEPLSLPDPYHLVGRTLADRYRLDALVGIGGMGAVYSAWHLAIDRRVAVKILQPNIAILDERMVSLFEREAKTVGRLDHENITNVFDAGRTTDGIAYMAMEWLEGSTLEEALIENKQLSLARTSEVLRQIAEALDAAHAAQIVHRDLKPSNVMLVTRPDGRERVKVVDFGIAKAMTVGTHSTHHARSMVVGTPAYASPEQLSGGREVDQRSDIYSLGVILYRMIAGELPFHAQSVDELMKSKLTASPTPIRHLRPEVPAAVELLLTRMLAANPVDRPQKASDVSALVAEAVAGAGTDATFEIAGVTRLEKAATGGPRDSVKPLLSELDAVPAVQRWIQAHEGGAVMAAVAAMVGLSAILLSHLVGSACIRVTLQASSGASETLLFGYVAEPNAGLWYLVGAPIFVIVAAHFFNLAHSSLRELVEGERLTVIGTGASPPAPALELIAARNRRVFRKLTPAILIASVAAIYIPEFASGPGPAFGWVGALSVKDYEGMSLADLQAQKKVGRVPAIGRLCRSAVGSCEVRVSRVDGGHGAADQRPWRFPFLIFLIVSLGLQVCFVALASWMAAKILFVFALLIGALINRSGPGLKIELDFEDTELRFGLGALDVVHNMVLLLILVASFAAFLQRATNVAKGSSFFNGMAGMPLVNQFATFLGTLVLLILILLAPMVVFMVLMETEVGRAIGLIERERAHVRKTLAGDTPRRYNVARESAEEHLRRRRDLARRQRPWPRRNPVYRMLLAAVIVMLIVLPFALEYAGVSGGGLSAISTAVAQLSETLCWLL